MFLWIFSSLSVIDRKFSALWESFSAKFVKTGFYVSQEKYWGQIIFLKKPLSIFFRTSIDLFSAVVESFFDEVVKTAFYVSIAKLIFFL